MRTHRDLAEALAKEVIASAIKVDEALRKTSDPITGLPHPGALSVAVDKLERAIEEVRVEYMKG